MDNNFLGSGTASTIGSVFFAIFAWILSLKEVQSLAVIAASGASIASCIFTIWKGMKDRKNKKE